MTDSRLMLVIKSEKTAASVLQISCKLYGTSADYLLGLTDIDPSDEARKQRQRLTEEEQNEMHRYEEYLLWKRKK